MATTRKRNKNVLDPYWYNPSISIFYQMHHGKDEVVIGTPLKFKYDRATYTFLKLVYHKDKDLYWIDCMDGTTGTFKSFYLSDLKGIVKPKRKRRNRVNVGIGTG